MYPQDIIVPESSKERKWHAEPCLSLEKATFTHGNICSSAYLIFSLNWAPRRVGV
jgi:hypothetical protein